MSSAPNNRLHRVDDWQARLNRKIIDLKPIEFEWGRLDCAIFALECIDAQCGSDLADYFKGHYEGKQEAFLRMRAWAGARGLPDDMTSIGDSAEVFFDYYGLRRVRGNYISRGDVGLAREVGMENEDALGVFIGGRLAVVHECGGLHFYDRMKVKKGWTL